MFKEHQRMHDYTMLIDFMQFFAMSMNRYERAQRRIEIAEANREILSGQNQVGRGGGLKATTKIYINSLDCQGAYGTVWKGTDRQTGNIVAVKQMSKAWCLLDLSARYMFVIYFVIQCHKQERERGKTSKSGDLLVYVALSDSFGRF